MLPIEDSENVVKHMEQVLSGTWCIAETGWVASTELLMPPDGHVETFHGWGETLAGALLDATQKAIDAWDKVKDTID